MAKSGSVNRNRIALLLTGILIAIFIAMQTQPLDEIDNQLTTQKVNTPWMPSLVSISDTLPQSVRWVKTIIRIMIPRKSR